MNKRSDIDVLIVGAGLVGLTLACALARHFVSVALVDRVDPDVLTAPSHDGRTTAVALGSQRVLQAIGVWEALAPVACPILDIRVSDGESPLFLHYDHREVGDAPFGYIVENRHLRQALLARARELPALDIYAPDAIVALERDVHRATVRLDSTMTLCGALVAACDGRNSRLRTEARIGVAEWRYKQTSIVCTVAHDRPHRHVAHERFLPAGPFAILPMTDDADGRHRSSIVWTEAESLAPTILALDEAAFQVELAHRFGDFLGAVEVVGPRWSYPLGLLHADRYVDRRLVLVGDAAHNIHPIAGQGLNLGWRDVAALTEVVVEAKRLGLDVGTSPVLERYQRWRRFDATMLIFVTDALNRLFSNDLLPVRLARDVGMAAVGRLRPLKRVLMRHAMGTFGNMPRLVRGQRL